MSSTININGETYIKQSAVVVGDRPGYEIVVADRGWVFVGYTTHDESGTVITGAKCVRIWGTDENRPGLGWLAANGPTEKTKLDDYGTVRIPVHALIATLDTDVVLWG